MTDGIYFTPQYLLEHVRGQQATRIKCIYGNPPDLTCTLDLRTLRGWLELQSVDTVAEVMAACVEELRQRRMSMPVSQDTLG